jgi:hypothetical protein
MMEIIIAMLEKMSEDVSYDLFDYEEEGKILHITVEDCEGFDENWHEIMRDYDADAVRELTDWLDTHCIKKEEPYSVYYYFEGFEVRFGYSSYDI